MATKTFEELYGGSLKTTQPGYGDTDAIAVALNEVLRVNIRLPKITAPDEYRLRFQLVDNTLVTQKLNLKEEAGDTDPVLASVKVNGPNPKVDAIVNSANSGDLVYANFNANVKGGTTRLNISFQKQPA